MWLRLSGPIWDLFWDCSALIMGLFCADVGPVLGLFCVDSGSVSAGLRRFQTCSGPLLGLAAPLPGYATIAACQTSSGWPDWLFLLAQMPD